MRVRHHTTWGGGGFGPNASFGGHNINSDSLLRRIRPNFKKTSGGSTATVIGAIIMIIGILLFMSPAFTPQATSGSMGPPPLIFVGFFMFPVGAMIIGVGQYGRIKDRKILTLIREIEASERISIQSLSINFVIGTAGTIMLIRRLIETKNLEGYEIIGEMGVAKITAGATPQDFMGAQGANMGFAGSPVGMGQPVGQPAQQRRTHCAGCSAPIRENTGRFCNHCGTKIG